MLYFDVLMVEAKTASMDHLGTSGADHLPTYDANTCGFSSLVIFAVRARSVWKEYAAMGTEIAVFRHFFAAVRAIPVHVHLSAARGLTCCTGK